MSSISTKPLVYVILANLGSPEEPTAQAVSTYLRDFLSDQRVVDANPLWWQPLLKLIRYRRSPRVVQVYQSVWTPEGAPLIAIQERLCRKLEQALASAYPQYQLKVVSAMTYRSPNITKVAQEVFQQHPDQVIVIPMYPQFSSSTTLSVIDGFNKAFADKNVRYVPPYEIVNNYYRQPLYIQALANTIRKKVAQQAAQQMAQSSLQTNPVLSQSDDSVSTATYQSSVAPKDYFNQYNKLFISFHGIPCRFVEPLGDPYQQHCEQTVALLAQELELQPEQYQLCYQSKFGKEPWLTPATDAILEAFAKSEPQAQAMVICPGFAIDCIETLEEIEEENCEVFMNAGGKAFSYVACLNDSEAQVALMQALVAQRLH